MTHYYHTNHTRARKKKENTMKTIAFLPNQSFIPFSYFRLYGLFEVWNIHCWAKEGGPSANLAHHNKPPTTSKAIESKPRKKITYSIHYTSGHMNTSFICFLQVLFLAILHDIKDSQYCSYSGGYVSLKKPAMRYDGCYVQRYSYINVR